MPQRAKPKTPQVAQAPGVLGDDYLADLTKPAPKIASALSGALDSALSEQTSSGKSEEGASSSSGKTTSAKRSETRVSKHHVSLYISPDVDRQMKRLALDEGKKTWETYHDALREYLDRKGHSFDQLNAS